MWLCCEERVRDPRISRFSAGSLSLLGAGRREDRNRRPEAGARLGLMCERISVAPAITTICSAAVFAAVTITTVIITQCVFPIGPGAGQARSCCQAADVVVIGWLSLPDSALHLEGVALFFAFDSLSASPTRALTAVLTLPGLNARAFPAILATNAGIASTVIVSAANAA